MHRSQLAGSRPFERRATGTRAGSISWFRLAITSRMLRQAQFLVEEALKLRICAYTFGLISAFITSSAAYAAGRLFWDDCAQGDCVRGWVMSTLASREARSCLSSASRRQIQPKLLRDETIENLPPRRLAWVEATAEPLPCGTARPTWDVSWFGWKGPFLRPGLTIPRRRAQPRSRMAEGDRACAARSVLDGGEHDARLDQGGPIEGTRRARA